MPGLCAFLLLAALSSGGSAGVLLLLLVRRLRRYYGRIRPLSGVHHRIAKLLPSRCGPNAASALGRWTGLPGPGDGRAYVREFFDAAEPRSATCQYRRCRCCLRPESRSRRSEPVFRRSIARPACPATDASPTVSRRPAHGSRFGMGGQPFASGTFTRVHTPVCLAVRLSTICQVQFGWGWRRGCRGSGRGNLEPQIRPPDAAGRPWAFPHSGHVATPSAAAILPIQPSPGHRLRHLPATGRVQRVVQGLIAQHRTGHRQ